MGFAKVLAGGLAANRIAFGLVYLLRPQQAQGSWIGQAARRPGAQVMTRSQGIRDVALGAGALWALVRGETPEARVWLVGHGVSDLVDLIATWVARDHLPERQARMAMAIAGGSTLVAVGALAGLRPAATHLSA